MPHLVAVDLETSGLDPAVHEMIEVGLVWNNTVSGMHEELDFSVSFDEEKADPKALEINGWGVREFALRWRDIEAAAALHDILKDAHIIGKNPSFDVGFLRAWFKKHEYREPQWHHRMIDIGNVCQGRFGMKYPPNTEEVERATGIKIPNGQRHSALADAKWAWDVFHYLLESRP